MSVCVERKGESAIVDTTLSEAHIPLNSTIFQVNLREKLINIKDSAGSG